MPFHTGVNDGTLGGVHQQDVLVHGTYHLDAALPTKRLLVWPEQAKPLSVHARRQATRGKVGYTVAALNIEP
jgi:hypothetical protein